MRGVVTNVLDIEILGGETGELGGEASPPAPSPPSRWNPDYTSTQPNCKP